jgi:hypothetical protein
MPGDPLDARPRGRARELQAYDRPHRAKLQAQPLCKRAASSFRFRASRAIFCTSRQCDFQHRWPESEGQVLRSSRTREAIQNCMFAMAVEE